MLKIAVRNIERDLSIVKEAEALLQEVNNVSAVAGSLSEAVEVAKYWTGVAHVLMTHQFIEDIDVFMADKLAKGKRMNF